ncbi:MULTISPECIES: WXG100 family type VII secretion target [Streptomyces]|uniref:WXG100 family type VII secretion target n=1 Tax=Streptomyces TaxID=1883 RepID=UPI00351E57F6
MPDIESVPIYVGQGLETAGQDINAAAQHIMGELHALRSRIQSLIDTWNAQSAKFGDQVCAEPPCLLRDKGVQVPGRGETSAVR